jgi:hypothetical protein
VLLPDFIRRVVEVPLVFEGYELVSGAGLDVSKVKSRPVRAAA